VNISAALCANSSAVSKISMFRHFGGPNDAHHVLRLYRRRRPPASQQHKWETNGLFSASSRSMRGVRSDHVRSTISSLMNSQSPSMQSRAPFVSVSDTFTG
jgi:hypothetical protein